MRAALEGKYSGDIDPDNDNGGNCDLELAGGCFELRIILTAPYSIEDGTTIRGTYAETADSVILHARELHSYTWETVKQEHTSPSARVLVAAFAAPGPERANVLDILIDARRKILLLREGLQAHVPAHSDLLAWLNTERSRRRAEAETRRTARLDAQAVYDAAAAFRAKDYPRVIMLLEPREERLTPSDRKKLALASRWLKEVK